MATYARRVGVLAFGLMASMGSAQAQTMPQTVSKWGLLGSWRIDCSQPASRSNGDLKYIVRNGMLFHDREFGDARDSNPVVAATAKRDGTLELTVNFPALSQTRQFAFVKGSDGRIRAVSNRNVNSNEYSIRDGKFTANGNETPWQTRCGGAVSWGCAADELQTRCTGPRTLQASHAERRS